METGKVTKQMISFQKAVIDNAFNGVSVMQDYSQNIMDGFLRQFPWITKENRKPLDDSIEFMKKARTDYKKAVDQGFTQLSELVSKQ